MRERNQCWRAGSWALLEGAEDVKEAGARVGAGKKPSNCSQEPGAESRESAWAGARAGKRN